MKPRSKTSVSIIVYIILFIVTIIAFALVLYFRHIGLEDHSSICLSIASGLLVSTFVGFLTDYGATKRKLESDKAVLTRIQSDLKYCCLDLLSDLYIAVYEVYGYEDIKKTFDEWVHMLFSFDDLAPTGKWKDEIAYVLGTIQRIEKKAISVVDTIISLDNAFVTDELISRYRILYKSCSLINHIVKRQDYPECETAIIKRVKPAILSIFDELECWYTNPYNETAFLDD